MSDVLVWAEEIAVGIVILLAITSPAWLPWEIAEWVERRRRRKA